MKNCALNWPSSWGQAGFRALFARALALATVEVPWMNALRIKPNGALEGLGELQGQMDPDKLSEGKLVLAAHLLGLLVAFIGEALTVQLVSEVWPKVTLEDLNFSKGGKDEEK